MRSVGGWAFQKIAPIGLKVLEIIASLSFYGKKPKGWFMEIDGKNVFFFK